MSIAPNLVLAAQESQRDYGPPTSATLAQYGLESGWGVHEPPGSNNPFGIKATQGEPSVMVTTREVIRGQTQVVRAAFRKFPDVADAFGAHARLLALAPVYGHAMLIWVSSGNLEAYVHEMARHYATDPSYGAKVLSIIQAKSLASLDLPHQKGRLV